LILASLIILGLGFFHYQAQYPLLSQLIIWSFFVGFYVYLFCRAWHKPVERNCIKMAIINGLLLVFYLSFERQRDTSVALFLQRNVDLKLAGLINLTPLQINSFFLVLMLVISALSFKFKIHSKLNLAKLLQIIPFLIALSFGLLWMGCKFFQANSGAGAGISAQSPLWPYLLSMIFMAFCNVLVFARFSQVCCAAMPQIRMIIASFMVGNMGFGAYLSRIIANFMAINQQAGIIEPKLSLKIYQNGFANIALICLFTAGLMIFFSKIFKTKLPE
jgi:hypothetical protein